MPCCCPPRTTTEPMSTLTRKFFTVASDPVVSCAQVPPSRDTLVSCAWLWTKLNGASRASTVANPTTCSAFFNSTTSFLAVTTANPVFLLPLGAALINLRQLRQHGPRLRLDVLARILCRQRHQHSANAAIRLDRLNQPQSFYPYSRISIVHQRAQDRVAHICVAL